MPNKESSNAGLLGFGLTSSDIVLIYSINPALSNPPLKTILFNKLDLHLWEGEREEGEIEKEKD